LKRVKDAIAEGKPMPMALREQRIWGVREKLFERVLPRLSGARLAQLLQNAHQVDGIVKGLESRRLARRPLASLAKTGFAGGQCTCTAKA
jgi:DNA polymerase III subunit delta